jgi:hypothetical protein
MALQQKERALDLLLRLRLRLRLRRAREFYCMRAAGIERAFTGITRQHATTMPLERLARIALTYVLSIQNTELFEVTLRL